MGLKEQQSSKNKEKIAALPERIENVKMVTDKGDYEVAVVKKQIKNGKGEMKNILTVDHEDFPADKNIIRMYLPLMGEFGHVPSEDEIHKLFGGESIKPTMVSANKGTEYTPTVTFSPLAEKEFNGRIIYYGDSNMSFD